MRSKAATTRSLPSRAERCEQGVRVSDGSEDEGAGHAFDNHNAAFVYNKRAAREAWTETADFLKRTLPV